VRTSSRPIAVGTSPGALVTIDALRRARHPRESTMTPTLRLLPTSMPLRAARTAAALLAAAALSGCGVLDLAGSAAGAVVSVTGAVVSTGVKVTGKVVEKAIDVAVPSDE
jgi:hypothetical protein